MRTFIQKLGKSLMGPLSIIVAAGLLLGLASTLQNPNVFGNALANVGFVNDDCVIIEPTQKDLENQGFVAGSICF